MPGFEARIINALATIPIRMISYGSNNNNVSLVIRAEDKREALQRLNDTLFAPCHANPSQIHVPTLKHS